MATGSKRYQGGCQLTEDNSEYMTATEARLTLGVTKTKLASLIRDGDLPVVESPLNKRVKLVRRADVERLKAQPRPKSLAA
jgi:hypothetical protein